MKVLFIGFGSIARKHMTAFNSLSQQFIFYALRSSLQSQEIEGVTSVYSWQEVPADISFAIISNPTNLHVEALEQCIERNLPVIVEKPVANTIDGLDVIVESLEKKKLSSYVACNLRFLPVLQFLHKEIKGSSRRINEVNVYCGSDLRKWRPDTDYKKSYSAAESQGGGVHLDLFHELDYLVWILGMPKSWQGIRRSVSSLEIFSADYAHYHFFYKEYTATISLNYYREDAKRKIEILFDDETWAIDLLQGTITSSDSTLIFDSNGSGIMSTYSEQAKHVIAILSGKVDSINTIAQSIEILKICLSSEKIN